MKLIAYSQHVRRRKKEWSVLAAKLFQTRELKKHYTSLEQDLSKQLQELSDYVSSMDNEYVFTATERMGSINYSLIPQLKELDLEQYRKEATTSWSIKKI